MLVTFFGVACMPVNDIVVSVIVKHSRLACSTLQERCTLYHIIQRILTCNIIMIVSSEQRILF